MVKNKILSCWKISLDDLSQKHKLSMNQIDGFVPLGQYSEEMSMAHPCSL